MSDLTPEALEWLRDHHGLTTRSLLRQHDVGPRTVDRLVRAGVLIPDHDLKTVLRLASTPTTFEQRCLALCLAHPRGFVTGPSGGQLEGLRKMPRRPEIQLAVPHGLHLPKISGVKFRQTTRIDPVDYVVRRDGIVVASPPRLAFDLAADLGRLDHLSVIEQLLHEGRCTYGTLVATARRLAHPRRPGSLRFVRNIAARGSSPAAESHPEVVLAAALRARGVPVEAQVTWLDLPNGRRIRVDLSVPEFRWGVEVDVHPTHLGLEGSTKDKRRDRQCHLIGWQVERVTELDLLDLAALVEELVALYEARRASLAA